MNYLKRNGRAALRAAPSMLLLAAASVLAPAADAGHVAQAPTPAATQVAASSPAFSIDEKSFRCITEMRQVGYFYVGNLAGDLSGTVRVAESTSGGAYPEGSVLQLVPTEAMVKREPGFNAATHDWEFFSLEVSQGGSQILARGAVEVNNRFGGNCFGCHVKTHPQWDLVCSNNHGCDPIPITRAMSGALQRTDPRCKPRGPVSAEDAAALKQLNETVKALAAAKAAQ